MSREILVLTPENIEIEYELAGVGTRLIANIIDQLIQFAVIAIILSVIGLLLYIGLPIIQVQAQVAIPILFFLVIWGYFIFFEYKWNGQTPGKRALGIRVIRDGGYPVDGNSVVVRNLLRVVDGMPILLLSMLIYGISANQPIIAETAGIPVLITLLCIMLTAKYQRIGDMSAGTIVIRQRHALVKSLDDLAPYVRVMPEHLASYALADIAAHIDEMTPLEYRAIRWYSDRRLKIPLTIQQAAAMVLAVPLMFRLGIRPPEGALRINYADLLEYLAVAFEQRRGAA